MKHKLWAKGKRRGLQPTHEEGAGSKEHYRGGHYARTAITSTYQPRPIPGMTRLSPQGRQPRGLPFSGSPIQYMVGPYVHVMALSLSRNLVRLTSCAANDGHIFSVKLSHTYQHPRPTTGPLCESNRIHEQFLQVGALPVHPYDHPAAKQPSIGQMNRKVYQLEAIDVVASSSGHGNRTGKGTNLGQTAPHSAPNSHVQEVLRTSYGSGTSNGRHSAMQRSSGRSSHGP